MERYFVLYPHDESKAIRHYQSNIQLAEAFYTSLKHYIATKQHSPQPHLYGGLRGVSFIYHQLHSKGIIANALVH